MTKKIAFKTLGCRLNQYETDAIASQFSNESYEVVNHEDDADVIIINTCTVTNQSDQKSRGSINQSIKRDGKVVVVTGCMVNNHKDKLEDKYKDVTYFVENPQKSQIYSIVDAHLKGETIQLADLDKDLFGFKPADKTFHTRSFIKIQDGCDNFCTYCIVPKVRGRATSRPVNDILDNIKEVLDFGYKEIVLTGVNISRYEFEGLKFENLVEKILQLDGDFRLRISSIEADGFTDHLFELFNHPKLAPHLHLCLQSGSDKVLLQMRRFYTVKSFIEITEKIKAIVPDFNFTTDIIVGFPNETEADFKQTIEVSRHIGFSHIHTFKYSIRNGTRAARMENQIPEKIKTQRSAAIRSLGEELKRAYRSSFIGKTQKVLVEKIDSKGIASGYGHHYIPVKFNAENISKNDFSRVLITGIENGEDPFLIGERI